MKIVQISDTHLTHTGGPTEDGFRRLVAHLNDVVRPDLVVHSGDLIVLDPDVDADRAHARALADLIDAPLLVIPGNHDVGMPGPNAWAGITVTDQRVAAHEAVWGPDHWRHDLDGPDGAVLIGIDSELLGSGLPRETDQWNWLAATLAQVPGGRPVLLFLHKPLWEVVAGPTDHQLDVAPAPRERLLGLVEGVELRVVGCGHLHRYRQVRRGDVLEVWAPATAFLAVTSDEMPPARDELGYVEYEVRNGTVTAEFHQVPGLPQISMTDIPAVVAALATLGAE